MVTDIVLVIGMLSVAAVVTTLLLSYTTINRSKNLKKHYNELIELKHDQLLQLRSKFARQNELPKDLINNAEKMPVDTIVNSIIQALPSGYRTLARQWAPTLIKGMESNPALLENIKGALKSAVPFKRPSGWEKEKAQDSV